VIFVSTMLYALSKKLGYEAAHTELMKQVQAHDVHSSTDWRGIPAAATIARIALIDEETEVNVTSGGTVISKCRSIAAAEFLRSAADVWFQVDDDVEVSREALEGMAAQARAEPCAVIAPCVLRETLEPSIHAPTVEVLTDCRTLKGRFPMQVINGGGFGCVAISRPVIERMHAEGGPALDFTERDGITRRALFADRIAEGKWWTEDLAFCRDLEGIFPIYAVRCGTTRHNGQALDLRTLEAP
jgi:hypothetical protein